MSTKKILNFPLLITLVAWVIGLYVYPQFPAQVASHWNAQGQVDGYMGRFWGVFLMPILSIGLYFLFLIIPSIDPQKANIAQFRSYFNRFIGMIFLFLLYLYLLTIYWNLGTTFDMVRMLVPALAVVIISAGQLIGKAKPNWSIGIRTPWTLSNETVWHKTHKLGAKFFIAVGVLSLLGLALPHYAFVILIVPLVAVALFLFVYSYVLYRQTQ